MAMAQGGRRGQEVEVRHIRRLLLSTLTGCSQLAMGLALVTAAAGPAGAAVPATCFPALPAVAGAPLFTMEVAFLSQQMRLDFWRQPCVDGSGQAAVLVQATPITPNPLLCSPNFRIIQVGVNIQGRIRTSTSALTRFCEPLPFTTTFVLDEEPGEPPFVEELPFTLVWATQPGNRLDIPQLRPPSPPPPRVDIVTTACVVCRAGDFAQVHLHLSNPTFPRTVEIKVGTHFPDGVTVLSLLDPHLEVTVPPGESDILIPGIFLPEGLAVGIYLVEARLLDPVFGITLSLDYLSLTVIP